MRWSNVLRGLLMGVCDLIPGVSGGTVAVVLGIYDELLAAVGGFLSREWRRHVAFLLPLGVGIAAALLLFSRAIDYLLEHHFVPIQLFFMGLILGVLPMLWRRSGARRAFGPGHFAVMGAAAAAVAALAFIHPDRAAQPDVSLSAARTAGLFLSGAAAAVAMLLPGISGSFVLLVLGVYPTAIHALATLHVPLMAVIGGGVATGLIAGSKLISGLLSRWPTATYAAIIGLIIGSVFVVFPGFGTPAETAAGTVTFVAGFALAAFFGRHHRD